MLLVIWFVLRTFGFDCLGRDVVDYLRVLMVWGDLVFLFILVDFIGVLVVCTCFCFEFLLLSGFLVVLLSIVLLLPLISLCI